MQKTEPSQEVKPSFNILPECKKNGNSSHLWSQSVPKGHREKSFLLHPTHQNSLAERVHNKPLY